MKKVTLIITISILLLSCVSVKVDSNKAADYQGKPKRILVYANTPNALKVFNKTLTDSLMREFMRRDIATMVLFRTPVSFPSELDETVKLFSADAVFTITPTMVYEAYGESSAGSIEISLVDVASNKVAWKSSMEMSGETSVGIIKGVRMIIKKMEEDQIVTKPTSKSGS